MTKIDQSLQEAINQTVADAVAKEVRKQRELAELLGQLDADTGQAVSDMDIPADAAIGLAKRLIPMGPPVFIDIDKQGKELTLRLRSSAFQF